MLEQNRVPVSLCAVEISYGLDCNGTPGRAVTLGRRTSICIGPSERTMPTAAVRVGGLFVQSAHRAGSAELIAVDRTVWQRTSRCV